MHQPTATALDPATATPTDPGARPVTVIGLGAMGATLARTFLAAGHPTTVWNRTPGRADDLVAAGATRAASLAAAVTASPLVIVCVIDATAARSLLEPLGDELAGRTVANLTSMTPEDARALAAWAAERGIDYLDGAVMVPTPVVGSDDTLVLYSGPREVFAAHRDSLASLGGTADHVGEDAGLASLHDLGMLDIFFAGMTAFLHATALVGADGVEPERFLPYARSIVDVLGEVLPSLAAEVTAGHHPGDEDTIAMELTAMEHIVAVSRDRGIDTRVPELTRDLLASAVEQGHGGDTFSRVVELLRAPTG